MYNTLGVEEKKPLNELNKKVPDQLFRKSGVHLHKSEQLTVFSEFHYEVTDFTLAFKFNILVGSLLVGVITHALRIRLAFVFNNVSIKTLTMG